MKLALVVGNKNYSSWSMRPWVLLRQAGIPFEEVQLKFDESGGGLRVAGIERYSAAGKVPVLLVDGEPVWDTLAICETVAELYPDRKLWPQDPRARRVARSVCAEMHSGFQALRGAMPMNIRSRYPGKGLNEKSSKDIQRVVAIWSDCRARFGKAASFWRIYHRRRLLYAGRHAIRDLRRRGAAGRTGVLGRGAGARRGAGMV